MTHFGNASRAVADGVRVDVAARGWSRRHVRRRQRSRAGTAEAFEIIVPTERLATREPVGNRWCGHPTASDLGGPLRHRSRRPSGRHRPLTTIDDLPELGGLRSVGRASAVLFDATIAGVRMAAYQASKFAVMGYGDTLREELADEGIGVTVMFPGGMMTRHLETSARARPSALGATGAQDDDLMAMLAHSPLADGDVVTADHAVRNLVADLVAGHPYVVTHGSVRAGYQPRRDAIEAALDRMEQS